MIGFYVDTPLPAPRYSVRYPLPCMPEQSYWRGSVDSPCGDKLLITYKERLASPKNASVKRDSAQSAQPLSAPGSLGQDALSQGGGQKVSKCRHVSLAGLFGVFLLQHR